MIDSIEERKSEGFDLAERTAIYSESIIEFLLKIRRNEVNGPLIRQLVRSATSIGANYLEADEAGSRKEFIYRISVCCREARETQYWLRLVAKAAPAFKEEARKHWQEAKELTLIFATIYRKSKSSKKK